MKDDTFGPIEVPQRGVVVKNEHVLSTLTTFFMSQDAGAAYYVPAPHRACVYCGVVAYAYGSGKCSNCGAAVRA